MWIKGVDGVCGWCIRINDDLNRIRWMSDYQRWHTIHLQIIMIRYWMRCVIDELMNIEYEYNQSQSFLSTLKQTGTFEHK